MKVGILGPLEVRVDGTERPIGTSKQKAILGVLISRANQVVDAEQLLDEVWAGTPPEGGLRTLRYHVSKLRDQLVADRSRGEEGPITTVGSGYRLALEPDEIDANRFERLATTGVHHLAKGQFEAAESALGEALGLWRGDAWQDFRYEEFAQALIARLEELRLVCTEDLVDARLGRGEHLDLIAVTAGLTTTHPLRERFWAQRMTALYRAGRQADAAKIYDGACQALGEELGVTPNRALQRLHRQVVEQSLPLRTPRETTPKVAGLPAVEPSFIGRTQELGDLDDLLDDSGVVTLVGTGGVGKTSLAVEVASRAADDGRNVFFVNLVSVADGEEVAPLVARSCAPPTTAGRTTIDDAVDAFGPRSALLIMDNCEHVLQDSSEVIRYLGARCPNLSVLATSRQPLRIDGENVYPLGPLSDTREGDGPQESEVVNLFADRAARAQGSFEVDEHNRSVVLDICRHLDCLPLAIELAAARLNALTLEDLQERLDQRFEILVDDRRDKRHRTMLATIEWSHDLLSPGARILLRRMAILSGTSDLAAILGICRFDVSDEAQVLDQIAELLETSLLTRDRSGAFSMLETIRAFAQLELHESGERAELAERHANYFALQATNHPPFGSEEELEQMSLLGASTDNQTAALDWSLSHDRADLAIELASGLALHWYVDARGDDALHWLVAAVQDGESRASPARAGALASLGRALPWLGRHEEALAVADELDWVADRLCSPSVDADALGVRAALASVTGDERRSRRLVGLAVSALQQVDDPKLSAFVWQLAYLELLLGNRDRAGELADELEELAIRWKQPLMKAEVPMVRGLLADFDGDSHGALTKFSASLVEMRRLGIVGPTVHPLRSMCDTAVSAEKFDFAEDSAREFLALASRTGEIAALPHGHNALAAVALARDEHDAASAHVLDSVAVIRRTRSMIGIDQTLMTAGRVARKCGREEQAACLFDSRARRRRTLGLCDTRTVARVVDRETEQLGGHVDHGSVSGHEEPESASLLTEMIVAAVSGERHVSRP